MGFFFPNKLNINKLVVLLASCIAQVFSLYITSCMQFCLCESFLCKRGGEEKKTTHYKRVLHTDCRKRDRTPDGSACKRSRSGRSSSQAACFAYHYGYVLVFFFNQPPQLWGTGSLSEMKINKLSGWLQVKTQQNIGT